MNRVGLQALLSHWMRNPLQLFTLIVGLSLATALWSGVQAINAEARASYDAAAGTLGEGQFAQIVTRSGDPLDQVDYIALRRAGWLVSPVVEGRIDGLRIIGIEPLTAPGGLGPIEAEADVPLQLMQRGLAFGRSATLEHLDIDPDRKVALSTMPPGVVMIDIGLAQSLLGMEDKVSRLIVAPAQPLGRPDLQDVRPGLSLRPPQEAGDFGRLTDSFHLNLTAFGFLAFAVGIFIVHGAIGLAFEQRRPVIRTLRALGVPLRRLLGLMAIELLGIALLSGALGVALGYVVAASLLPDVAATLRGLYGEDVSGTLSLRPEWWLSGLAIALVGTALAAGSAFAGLARMPLLSSAMPRALAMSAGQLRRLQAAVALALLALAAVLLVHGEGLATGFALLAALLVGGALMLPVILGGLLGLAARHSRRPTWQWFWSDSRQQLPGLSLALMALLLAMAANVGVSTMVSSFRLTFLGFLDQRLASEFYVYADDADQARTLAAYLEPRVEAVLPIQMIRTEIAGIPTEVHGPRPHDTYRDNWAFLQAAPAAWERIDNGEGIAINEQLARRGGILVGDVLDVGGQGFEVVGIHGDYGNPLGQILVTSATFRQLFPEVEPLRFALRLPPDKVPDLVRGLRDDFGLSDANMVNQAGIKAFSLEVFDRTFRVTDALNILTLAVAAFAILMSLLTLAAMRLPQLAPVWALGLTRRQIGCLELVRAIILSFVTTALALPLGLALAWVLLAVVNVEAFGWRLPMALFPLDYLTLGALAVLAALLAALWPAMRLARTPPATLLQVFSSER